MGDKRLLDKKSTLNRARSAVILSQLPRRKARCRLDILSNIASLKYAGFMKQSWGAIFRRALIFSQPKGHIFLNVNYMRVTGFLRTGWWCCLHVCQPSMLVLTLTGLGKSESIFRLIDDNLVAKCNALDLYHRKGALKPRLLILRWNNTAFDRLSWH